jgi:hypothetical protein
MTCPVNECTYNKSGNRPVACPHCPFTACRGCHTKYLLDAGEPKCMSCGKAWGAEFLGDHFPKSFVKGGLSENRKKALFAREQGLFPETLPLLEERERLKGRIKAREGQITTTRAEICGLTTQLGALTAQLEELKLENARDLARQRMAAAPPAEAPAAEAAAGEAPAAAGARGAPRRHCPRTGCNSFLSAKNKCLTCPAWMCRDCEKLKEGPEDPGHACSPDDVATVKLKREECRPCPACGVETFKIDGCSQVWCPPPCGGAEGTAWNFTTGVVDKGRPHAPLYYEYLRKKHGGEAPRVPGDDPCARLPDAAALTRFFQSTGTPRQGQDALLNLHRMLVHIDRFEAPRWRRANPSAFEANLDLRLAFLSNALDEEAFKSQLQRREKEVKKAKEFNEALRLLVDVGSDIIAGMLRGPALTAEVFERFEQVREFYNGSIRNIRARYGSKACFLLMTTAGAPGALYGWALA